MSRKLLALSIVLLLSFSMAVAADTSATRNNLSAAEIVRKNVAARGGLEAWRAVQSLTWEGKMGVGGSRPAAPASEPVPNKKTVELPTDPRPEQEVLLPFVMEMQRPRKTRFELQFKGQTAVQVFDGASGWKLRPYLNRLEVEPYTADEMKRASMVGELDGPLVDYAAKGTAIETDGMEKVENRDTYKLKLTMKSGQIIHVWIDAQTFLDTKMDGRPRTLDGLEHPVEIYYRDYRPVDGLQIPFVLETKVLPLAKTATRARETLPQPEKILIDKVVVNPRLDAALFSKPQVQSASLTR